jgi:hypothetical protein
VWQHESSPELFDVFRPSAQLKRELNELACERLGVSDARDLTLNSAGFAPFIRAYAYPS